MYYSPENDDNRTDLRIKKRHVYTILFLYHILTSKLQVNLCEFSKEW